MALLMKYSVNANGNFPFRVALWFVLFLSIIEHFITFPFGAFPSKIFTKYFTLKLKTQMSAKIKQLRELNDNYLN